MKQFQLDPKKRINKLSKGMLSMVTIIVALASKADFTILDEPVAGLDVIAREKFYHLLLEEYENTDRTFVVSTHIIEEAALQIISAVPASECSRRSPYGLSVLPPAIQLHLYCDRSALHGERQVPHRLHRPDRYARSHDSCDRANPVCFP